MRDPIISISLALTLIFFISAYVGYTAAQLNPGIDESLRKFFEGFRDYMSNPVILMLIIFANNAGKGLIAMLAGFFFGIFPVLFISLNGYIVGIVISLRQPEWGVQGVLMAILPHGILEIPAIIIACSYGVWLGYRFYRSLFTGETFKPYLMHALRVYLKVIVPILLIAAAVEAFITPMLISSL